MLPYYGADDASTLHFSDESGADIIVPVETVTNGIIEIADDQTAAARIQQAGHPTALRRDPRLLARIRSTQASAVGHVAAAKSAPKGSPEAKAVAESFLRTAGDAAPSLLVGLLQTLTGGSKAQAAPTPTVRPAPMPTYRPPAWQQTAKKAAFPVGLVALLAAFGGVVYLVRKGRKK